MTSLLPPTSLTRALRAGLFEQARKVLDQQGSDDPSTLVDRIEVLNQLGAIQRACSEAQLLLKDKRISPRDSSRCMVVLGDGCWYSGNFESAISFYRRAVALAEDSEDIRQACLSTAVLLERTSEGTRIDGSVPTATRVRKLAVQSGDAHLIVYTHLTFGRLEARAGHFDTARRHFAVARGLLASESNAWLSAAVALDECGVLSVCGDLAGAVDLAKEGALFADERMVAGKGRRSGELGLLLCVARAIRRGGGRV